jgi:hypothetical protein
MDTFQRLYDSEINYSISCFWDGGFEVRLGDPLNGFAAGTHVANWSEVEPWLRDAALRHYPESSFAREIAAAS